MLAHAPFSEVLAPALVEQAVTQGQRWISTLAIHAPAERAIAIDNVRAFAAAGGEVLYGSDLGNSAPDGVEQPLGLNSAELAALVEAGFDETAVLRSLVGGFGRGRWKKRVSWMPARPATPLDIVDAVSLSVGDLEGAGA